MLVAGHIALAAKVCFPEGFSMRVGVQHFLLAVRAARVDKPRKEEAVGVWDQAMGKEHRRVRLTLPRSRGRLFWRRFAAASLCQLCRKHFTD